MVQVLVRLNNVEQALKALKKFLQREGFFRVIKAQRCFEKPSVAKARKRKEAQRKSHKDRHGSMMRDR